jgi:predicted metal-dependent HD superfamily phosphohydrolase
VRHTAVIRSTAPRRSADTVGGVDLTERWPLSGHDELRERLLTAYAEPTRGYHDLRHLQEVLDRVDELRDELGSPDDLDAVLLAAWFHDAVYAGAADDEERSAKLAERELAGAVDDDTVAEVARLVRLTRRHRPEAEDRSGQVLSDADLAILAADDERYAEYTSGVRHEYPQVDDATFRAGRAAVLEELLAKSTLFHTRHGRKHWEEPARHNVRREIEQLRAG